MAYTERPLGSREIFEGRVFRVTVDEVELVNGAVSTREVVHHGGGAAVLALNDAGEVALVRQFRYAAGRELIEIPAGKIEPGEAPEVCALRELGEEVGCSAASFEAFGRIIPTCAYCTEVIYLFVARQLSHARQHLDADEFLDVIWMPLEQAVQKAVDGEFEDSKTVVALLRAAALRGQGLL